jgi:hypothetical protein
LWCWLLAAAGVVDAARYSARAILNSGMSLTVVPGGGTLSSSSSLSSRSTPSCSLFHDSNRGTVLRPRQRCRVLAKALWLCQACVGDWCCTGACVLIRTCLLASFLPPLGSMFSLAHSQNECNTYSLLGVDHPYVHWVKRKFQVGRACTCTCVWLSSDQPCLRSPSLESACP